MQLKKLSSLTRNCNLRTFPVNETIIDLSENKLSQEESGLLIAGVYYSSQPGKLWNFNVFTIFETESLVKAHLSYRANSYYHNYEVSPCALCPHRLI